MSAEITVRFWAGAQRAAGHESETIAADSLADLREILAARPALTAICAAASLLVDGQQASENTVLHAGAVVDVLPPFAGG
ncbi:MAG: MoaD/ThiS family protein [Jatrophihabitantaceae bacterium]